MKIAGAACGILGIFIASLLAGCKKDTMDGLMEDHLTECADCDLIYTKSAKLDGFRVAKGNKLVFQYIAYWKNENPAITGGPYYTGLFFEVGTSKSSFTMGKKEIAGGDVVHLTMCPTCNTIQFEAVDGSIRGKKVSGNRWLVDAEVILAAAYDDHIMDTMRFKQYFVPHD